MKRLYIFFISLMFISNLFSVTGKNCSFAQFLDCSRKNDINSPYKCDNELFGKTFFSFRPQDSNSARRILGFTNTFYGNWDDIHNFRIAFQYYHSFNTEKIARWFFFNGCDYMTVGIPDADTCFDIDGSQIGLSLDMPTTSTILTSGCIGSVCAHPIAQNVIIDFDIKFDLNEYYCGFWTRINAILVRMETNFDLQSFEKTTTTQEFYPAGLFSIDGVGTPSCTQTRVPYLCIEDALQGNCGWGAVPALQCGKISKKSLTTTALAGIHLDLGYDFYMDECVYIAGSIHGVIPTGTRPKGIFLFEPIVGANKSWQIGTTFEFDYIKDWRDHCFVGLYMYGVTTHLFKSRQTRVFSLRNNCAGSQVLLAKKFNPIDSKIMRAERMANVLCGETYIGAVIMLDWSIMFQLSSGRFLADLGYNFWYRSKEKRNDKVCLNGFEENQLAIKGGLPLTEQVDIGCPDEEPVCTYNIDTASCSTICKPAAADACPVYIQPCDINFGSALQPASFSNKVFGGFGYNCHWFFIISGEAEFGHSNAALNQWSVMLKLGRDF